MRNVYCGVCGKEHITEKETPFTLELTCADCGKVTHIECDHEQITATNFYPSDDD